jgi:hypothetical protein
MLILSSQHRSQRKRSNLLKKTRSSPLPKSLSAKRNSLRLKKLFSLKRRESAYLKSKSRNLKPSAPHSSECKVSGSRAEIPDPANQPGEHEVGTRVLVSQSF